MHELAKTPADFPPFFWLHLKKCGGESFRKTFTPPYVQTVRTVNPSPFIAVPREEWNDVLNNYRIPLGEYDYRRMLFAKKFLYTEEEFSAFFKFTIVRNPYDRIVSAWRYLMAPRVFKPREIWMKYSFQRFLEELPKIWVEKRNRHIATHTAPIWGDITDEKGNLLVNFIAHLENIESDLAQVSDRLGGMDTGFAHINRSGSSSSHSYRKAYNRRTRQLVESLYYDDIQHLGYEF
jgi:hypothetical protein